jgi:hypothetical protein
VAMMTSIAALLLASAASLPTAMLRGIVQPPCGIAITSSTHDRESITVNCGCGDVVVTSPQNLLGHVKIRSSADALAFVRFFTSLRTFELVDLDGFVDVVPAGTPSSEIFVVPERYRGRATNIHQARVELISADDDVAFEITRCVVSIDGAVYEVREVVGRAGDYQLRSRRLLYRHSSMIGITHFGRL